MSDTNKGQIQADVQTAAPMPSANQPAAVVEEPTLPDQVKERTAAEFEKLKESNRQLSQELKTLKGGNPSPTSVLDELRPHAGTVPQATVPAASSQPLTQSVIDEGGYVDASLLNSTLKSAKDQAEEAKRIAQQTQSEIQRFQESQVVAAVHRDYPEIDPNNQDHFDPAVYDFVKNELVAQLLAGQNQDLPAAAAKARQTLGKSNTPAARKENISSREVASAPTGTGRSIPDSVTQNDLVEGTRRGDKDAIFKRLQASGY